MGKVLVTGGAGYIGSHTVIQLAHAGLEVAVLDNLFNSSRGVIARLEELTGKTIQFIHADVRDRDSLRAAFSENAY